MVADTGFYQVTFGVMPKTGTSGNIAFQLQLNGSPATPIGGTVESIGSTTFTSLSNVSIIIRITTNPSTLTVVNVGSGTVQLESLSLTATGAPAAYVTIVKLQ